MTDPTVSPDQHDPSDQLDRGPVPAPRHRVRAAVLAGVAGALVLGGGSYAYASGDGGASTPGGSTSGSTSTSTTADGETPPAPPADAPPADAPKPGPHIDGTVKAVDGDTVTVADRDGFTRTINTSSDTTYGEGLSAPLATGTEIHATGTVNADGTSLDATGINAAPKPGEGPAGGPGGKGPGADGGPAAIPPAAGSTDAPSGAPSAPAAPSDAPSGAPSGAPSAPAAPSSAPSGAPSGTATSEPSGS